MTIPVLFIHGGGEGAHAADAKLAASLQEKLGPTYRVHCPPMPNENAPEYAAWQVQIRDELNALTGAVVLVGHSLGGSILLKYLAEERITTPIAGLFLVAVPYWGAVDWEVEEYMLSETFAAHLPASLPIALYHSRDDEIVPFDHMARYAAQLPQATLHAFADGGHQCHDDLSAVAQDIRQLENG